MLLLCVVAVALMASLAESYDTTGHIINSSGMDLVLTVSDMDHGDLDVGPAIKLPADSQTFFKISSPPWNDRILYTFVCPLSSLLAVLVSLTGFRATLQRASGATRATPPLWPSTSTSGAQTHARARMYLAEMMAAS